MIDLSRTRAELLAEIGASDLLCDPLSDITDPRVANTDVYVRLQGNRPEDLFPFLKVALTERFAPVPLLQLVGEFLMPLRNAIGNAYKHGNGQNPAKSIFLEIALTDKGAFVTVTDEGSGFDPGVTFQRLQQNENYFENYGAGFRNFHRTKSTTVSYENEGRTVLLCYRPGSQNSDKTFSSFEEPARDSIPHSAEFSNENHILEKVLDPGWVGGCLADELPEFKTGRATLESCRTYARNTNEAGNTYVLRINGGVEQLMETRLLTGRFHATEAGAAADFESAAKLYKSWGTRGVLIPRPVERLVAEPRLVLYDFWPWMNFSDFFAFFTSLGGLSAVRHSVRRIAHMLAALHRSQVMFPFAEPDLIGERFRAMVGRLETHLQTMPEGTDFAQRFRDDVQRVLERATFRTKPMLAPIHGALRWDCIYYSVDNCFYLYRFENCQYSDPRLDLGGFLADLLLSIHTADEKSAYVIFLEDFLSEYNALAACNIEKDDLLLYIVLSLIERFDRMQLRMNADVKKLLTALDVALWRQEETVQRAVPA